MIYFDFNLAEEVLDTQNQMIRENPAKDISVRQRTIYFE